MVLLRVCSEEIFIDVVSLSIGNTASAQGIGYPEFSPSTTSLTSGKAVTKTYDITEGSRGYAVVLDAYERELRRIETSGPTWQYWPSSFYGEILNMVECIRNGAQTISGPEFGAECSAIVGASYLSEQNGRRAASVEEFKAFARGIGEKYGDDLKAADNALVEALLSALRK